MLRFIGHSIVSRTYISIILISIIQSSNLRPKLAKKCDSTVVAIRPTCQYHKITPAEQFLQIPVESHKNIIRVTVLFFKFQRDQRIAGQLMAEDETGRTEDVCCGSEIAGRAIQEIESRLLEAQTSGLMGMSSMFSYHLV